MHTKNRFEKKKIKKSDKRDDWCVFIFVKIHFWRLCVPKLRIYYCTPSILCWLHYGFYPGLISKFFFFNQISHCSMVKMQRCWSSIRALSSRRRNFVYFFFFCSLLQRLFLVPFQIVLFVVLNHYCVYLSPDAKWEKNESYKTTGIQCDHDDCMLWVNY